MLWALILAIGLFVLPESPRFYIRNGKKEEAIDALARIRGQPKDSEFIQLEINEIEANYLYEIQVTPDDGYFNSWMNCFRGNIFHPNSNLRRTVLGTSLQMMQQWTGVNFVFYYGTPFFTQLGTISDPFLISMITTIVNVLSTPISFYAIEKVGRRPLLLWGALGMVICQFLVAIIGVTDGQNPKAVSAMISFICIYIFFFATTWGPGAWVVIGEIFPLPIRSRGVALSTASNWLWNCIIAVITPYMTDADQGNLGPKVFFIWGSLCACAFVYTYFLIPETKGLTLEQVDKMMEETTPRTSAKWQPHSTFADEMGLTDEKSSAVPQVTQHEV
jgi:sugar porter (SP) family MFS transporter